MIVRTVLVSATNEDHFVLVTGADARP